MLTGRIFLGFVVCWAYCCSANIALPANFETLPISQDKIEQKHTKHITGITEQVSMLALNVGDLLSKQGYHQQAESLLVSELNLAKDLDNTFNELRLLKGLIDNAASNHQWRAAYYYQRQLSEFKNEFDSIEFNEFNVLSQTEVERGQNKKIIYLRKENQLKNIALSEQKLISMLLISSLLLLIFSTSMLLRRQYSRRQARKSQLEHDISIYRERVIKLGHSHDSLKAAFGQLRQALLILNSDGTIIFVNEAATSLFGKHEAAFHGTDLHDFISSNAVGFWNNWNNKKELDHHIFRNVDINLTGSAFCFDLRVKTLNREEKICLVSVLDCENTMKSHANHNLLHTEKFHERLVDLMLSSLELWELSTQSTRIELAENSGIWRVSIDNGRLRTRSMDRYLTLRLLPKKPRWKEMLRTANFVLNECTDETPAKQLLSTKLEKLSRHTRTAALS